MRRRNLEELAIIELCAPRETITHAEIRKVLIEKPSDTIYFILDGSLWGIVCLGDWLHRAENGNISIATKFTSICGFKETDARRIFIEKKNVHKVPVTDSKGSLLGDYSRWDDGKKAYCNWILNKTIIWRKIKKWLKEQGYQTVYIITPQECKSDIKNKFLSVLNQRNIKYTELNKEELIKINDCKEKTLIVTVDEEEERGVWGIDGFDNHKINGFIEWSTIHKIYQDVSHYDGSERLIHYSASSEGEGAFNLLKSLEEQGVKVLELYSNPYYLSDYVKDISRKISDYRRIYPDRLEQFKTVDTPDRIEYFNELLENEDYCTGVAQEEIILGHQMYTRNADFESKYYNVIDGKRKICYPPPENKNTIHMFGQCIMMGAYLEDKNTLMSLLQKRLSAEGYPYLVITYGGRENIFVKMEKITFVPGDVVIVYTGEEAYSGLDAIDMRKVFEEHNVPAEYFLESMTHFNHKVADILAAECFKKIKTFINTADKAEEKNILFKVNDYNDVIGKYIKNVYLDRFFEGYDINTEKACLVVDLQTSPKKYEKILQRIRDKETQIILFIPSSVQDTQFSPEEYIDELLVYGNMDNSMYVVSGDGCVPYKNFFGAYYHGRESLETTFIEEQAMIDVKVFAQCIALQLNIKRRYNLMFEEKNQIEYCYSKVLREELPKYDIEYIELE